MKSKKAHSKRPSKLETQLRLSIKFAKLDQLRLSIKFAKLEARINALEAEVLRIGRKDLISDSSEVSHFWGVRGWSVWVGLRRKSCLGRELTLSEAMAIAEKDKANANNA